jgi:hypothetical protein
MKLEELAANMLNPLRCGGAGYDKDGKYYLMLGGKQCNAKEANQIIRQMNPTWSEESLKPYLLNEDR